ncbi:hypothetical protein SAMN05216419_100575 [Nitrosomonas cryotolerans]|uniref:Uncharacterized protein n=1 Tax=Nitrosomonas cryotolerans ATCC 49181 TaxID=1131553 RepID=A0A1N6G3I5_9PROT|nr:hypothetical protein [Nitrosomonas cryotolerans]SFP52700.1 hypothetical protein SAMN05216419_100575 [Nitrosomonas cryotolerans]SIO02073.1 hypothetical protein SAMN02743940_0532 [Nitrosomonas cryotolerans ATCC 49181]
MLRLTINSEQEEFFSNLEEVWCYLNLAYSSLADPYSNVLKWRLSIDGHRIYCCQELPAIAWYVLARTFEYFKEWLSFQLSYSAKLAYP